MFRKFIEIQNGEKRSDSDIERLELYEGNE